MIEASIIIFILGLILVGIFTIAASVVDMIKSYQRRKAFRQMRTELLDAVESWEESRPTTVPRKKATRKRATRKVKTSPKGR